MKRTERIRRPRETKEIIAFWWEIYRALVTNKRLLGGLPTANTPDLDDVFKVKRKTYYEPWGDVTNTTFDAWWRLHREKCIEEAAIQEIPNEKIERTPTRLYLSINLKKPKSTLLDKLEEWIVERQTRQGLLKVGKRKPKREALIRYNEAMQIHLPTFREQYRFFKYVYLPELYPTGNLQQVTGEMSNVAGMNLWKAAQRYYRGKPKPKYLKLGNSNLTRVQKESALRTLRRYVIRLDDMCRHVAHGQFP